MSCAEASFCRLWPSVAKMLYVFCSTLKLSLQCMARSVRPLGAYGPCTDTQLDHLQWSAVIFCIYFLHTHTDSRAENRKTDPRAVGQVEGGVSVSFSPRFFLLRVLVAKTSRHITKNMQQMFGRGKTRGKTFGYFSFGVQNWQSLLARFIYCKCSNREL